ncbi:MAG: SusC/RagA family TonB-linked outer membrane protein, partial [Bacteroidota bacterium]
MRICFTIIRSGIFLSFLMVAYVSSAQRTISGKVTDSADGTELPGATVFVKGTTNGVITDIEGNYTLTVADGVETLVVSYIGFLTQEVLIAGRTTIDFGLAPNLEELSEVVVIGYGTQQKKEVTGAVASLSAEEFGIQPTADVGEALQGRLAGVNIQASSGRPGDGVNVQIRGLGSINGADPLYVVDGIPFQGTPNIPPEQIKSIDVLKDGASAAIYGVRASNGVVLITTTSGQPGKIRVDVSSYYGIQNIVSGTPLANAEEQLYIDQLTTDNLEQENTITQRNSNALFFNSNFVDDVTDNNAAISNYVVSVSGGQENLTFSATANYFQQDGILVNSGFDRLSSRITGEYKQDRFRARFTMALTEENQSQEPFSIYEYAVNQRPSNRPLDQTGQVGESGIQVDEDINLFTYGWVARILDNENKTNRNNTNYAMLMEYEIIDGLKAEVNLGRNNGQSVNTRFQPQVLLFNREGELNLLSSVPEASLDESYIWTNRDVFNGLLKYNKEFGKHHLNLLAGLTYEKYDWKNSGGGVLGLQSNSTQVLSAGLAGSQPFGTEITQTLTGKLARVQYDFMDKYLFSFNIRRDGSSNFSEDNRLDTFWGVSAGWNIAEESFFPSDGFIRSLKLRASYGRVGNQNARAYAYIPTIEGGINYPFGPDEAVGIGNISRGFANPELQWETVVSRNFGLDGEIWNGRIQFSADYYINNTEDMLLNERTPLSLGVTPTGAGFIYRGVFVNAGEMTNKGLEMALSYNNQTRSGLQYGLDFTFTRNRNEVTDLNGKEGLVFSGGRPINYEGESVDQTTFITRGREAGAFFLYESAGVIKTQEQLENYWDPTAQLGDMMFVDQNGDSLLTDEDRVYAGSGMPDFEAGVVLSAAYKGFDLTVQGYYAFGQEIFNGPKLLAYMSGRHRDLTRQWTEQ